LTLVHLLLGSLLLFLGENSLILAEASIVHGNEALSHLEEILIRLVGSEVDIEGEGAHCFHLLHVGLDSERILHPLTGGLVHHVEQGPVHSY